MKLKLIAEGKTKQETIDYLVDGVPRIVPVPLDLSVIGERYSKGSVWMYNLHKLGALFPQDLDTHLLILTDSSFSYQRKGLYPAFELVRDRHGVIYFAGLCDNESRIIIVGGENSPSDSNVKIASHEIAHAILKHTATWDIQAIHCKNYVGDKRCVMNVEEIQSKDVVEETYLGFCQPCTDSMREKIN